jgi:hypothetical protein
VKNRGWPSNLQIRGRPAIYGYAALTRLLNHNERLVHSPSRSKIRTGHPGPTFCMWISLTMPLLSNWDELGFTTWDDFNSWPTTIYDTSHHILSYTQDFDRWLLKMQKSWVSGRPWIFKFDSFKFIMNGQWMFKFDSFKFIMNSSKPNFFIMNLSWTFLSWARTVL